MAPFDKGVLKEKAFRLVFRPLAIPGNSLEDADVVFDIEQADAITGNPIMDVKNFLR
jgi:tRNA (Thr-GGU) A37 N-methylase